MSQYIHPTACIASSAEISDNVNIGAFVVIEDQVKVGAGSTIQAHAIIKRYVHMGSNNIVHSHVVLGDLPQDINFDPNTVSYLNIGNNNVFREGFTAHRATISNNATTISSKCFFMNHSHVAHDCTIGEQTIFANNVAIGGFVGVDNNVFIGGAAVVHQYCRIGCYAMIRGTAGLSMDIMPYTTAGGTPAKHYRLNTLGLQRAGITGVRYKTLAKAYRLLKNKSSLDGLEITPELKNLQQWLAVKSKRGVHGFV